MQSDHQICSFASNAVEGRSAKSKMAAICDWQILHQLCIKVIPEIVEWYEALLSNISYHS
jgi:hypothetical protein